MFSTRSSDFHSDFCELLLEENNEEKINNKFLAWVGGLDKLINNFANSYYKAISRSPVSTDEKKERVKQIKKIEDFFKNSIVEKYLSFSKEYGTKNVNSACQTLADSLKVIDGFILNGIGSKFPFLDDEITALNKIAEHLREIGRSMEEIKKSMELLRIVVDELLEYEPPSLASVTSKGGSCRA